MEKQSELKKILFICTGNTCRSPMAEGILKKAIANDAVLSNNFKACSAGLRANIGEKVSQHAASVLKLEFGIDISQHTAKILHAKDAKQAFLILTMENSHKGALINLFPEKKGKIFMLREYVSQEANSGISDPYMGDYDTYRRCAREIYNSIEELLDILKNLV